MDPTRAEAGGDDGGAGRRMNELVEVGPRTARGADPELSLRVVAPTEDPAGGVERTGEGPGAAGPHVPRSHRDRGRGDSGWQGERELKHAARRGGRRAELAAAVVASAQHPARDARDTDVSERGGADRKRALVEHRVD